LRSAVIIRTRDGRSASISRFRFFATNTNFFSQSAGQPAQTDCTVGLVNSTAL
jgi:hypothetical protein